MVHSTLVDTVFLGAGYSIGFDGTNDWVDFGDGPWIDGTADFSLQFWIKSDDVTGYSNILMKTDDNNSSTNGLRLRLGSLDKIQFLLKGGFEDGTGTTNLSSMTTGAALTSLEGTWIHVVVTADRDTNHIIYINGSASITSTAFVSNSGVSASNGGDLILGGNALGGDSPTESVGGDLTAVGVSELAFWDVSLDADAVAALYNSGSAINALADSGDYDNSGDLTGYWKLDEGTGTSSADLSGSHNGTVNNASWVLGSPRA